MRRWLVNAAVAFALMATGWVVAKAQTASMPDFEIVVDAPGGVESFDLACSGVRCRSAKVGGWLAQ